MVVQLSPYTPEKTVSEIRQEIYGINQTLPAASAIRRFYFTTDELAPPTAVKVSRAQLRRKIDEGQVKLISFKDYTAIQEEGENSSLMEEVRKIIASVLDVPVDTVEAGSHIFFDLGGTSIQYFSILTALSEHFEISGYEQTDKYCYTPKEICEYIERRL